MYKSILCLVYVELNDSKFKSCQKMYILFCISKHIAATMDVNLSGGAGGYLK